MQRISSILAVVLLGGCAGAAGRPSVAPVPLSADPALHEILSTMPLDTSATRRLEAYERAYHRSFLDNVAELAADPGASLAARLNALSLLGERVAVTQLYSLEAAAADPEPRVRAAAVAAAGQLLGDAGVNGRSIVVAAIEDSVPEVQAKALEVLGLRDPAVLRAFLERHTAGSGAEIARGLLHAAEQRGAPLVPDSAGSLRRRTAGGAVLEFRPNRQWPQWQAAVGTVTVTPPASPAFQIDQVEVVGGVVPVFFAPEEDAVVYERARRIYVRELSSGNVREVGSGIAPRPLPFTGNFVFLRPDTAAAPSLPERIPLEYQVVQASFAGAGSPRVLGKLSATAEMRLHGNYSPARWLRVTDYDTRQALEGEGSRRFELPSPFEGGS